MTLQEVETLKSYYADLNIPAECQWELHEEAERQRAPRADLLNEVDQDFMDRPEILARQVVSEAVAQECRQELAEAQKNGWKI